MLVIRPIEQKDFAGLKTCAIESGTGMTSLPVNDELLQRKIDASTQTFSDKPAGKGDCLYFFVAEDLETGEMVGTCAIDAAVGLSQPPAVLQLPHRQGGALFSQARHLQRR